MHGSDSQSCLINEYIQEKVENPLTYVEVGYERSEWDNIPTIIPRYCIHLSKHLESLVAHYKQKCLEESTAQLRDKMEEEILRVSELLNLEEDDRKITENDHLKAIEECNKKILALQTLEKEKEQRNLAKASEALLENFIVDESERLQVGYESQQFKKEQRLGQDQAKVKAPRMFSMQQIRDIVFGVLHSSQFRDDFLFHLNSFEDYKFGQHQTNESVQRQLEEQGRQIEELFGLRRGDRDDFDLHVKDYFRMLEVDHDTIAYLKNRDGKIQNEIEDIKGFHEVIEGRLEKSNYKINQTHDKLDLKVDGVKVKLEMMVKEQERKVLELREVMSSSLDSAKNSLCLQIDQLSEKQFKVVKEEIGKYEERILASKGEMREEVKEVTDKNRLKIKKIKEVCSGFFKSQDEAVKALKAKFTTVQDAFDIWNANILKPQGLKEATLYALDCQLREVEKHVYMDMDNVRDILNKLIYSLEQHVDLAKGGFKGKLILEGTLNKDQLEECLQVKSKHFSRKELGGTQTQLGPFSKERLNEEKPRIFNNQTINKRATFFTSALSQQHSPKALNQTAVDFSRQEVKEEDKIKMKGQELLFAKRLRFLRQKITNHPKSSELLKKVVNSQNLPMLQSQTPLLTSQEFNFPKKEGERRESLGEKGKPLQLEIGMEQSDQHSTKYRGSTKERDRTERAPSELNKD